MDLMGSFSSKKVNTFNFFYVNGVIGDNELLFLFDTGAACPVVGVNSFFDPDDEEVGRTALEAILKEEIIKRNVKPRPVPLKAANSQEVTTFPCICHGVSIGNSPKRDFYFDISFEDISIPLLGGSFIDDCAYSHAINGNINITSIKENAGSSYYRGYNVLDFDIVSEVFARKYDEGV